MILKMPSRNDSIRLLIAAAMLIVASFRVTAQDVSQYDHGTPPQHAAGVSAIGSYISADLGVINLSNGSLNVRLPLGNVGGRGFWLPLTLNYTSKVWSARTGTTPVFDPTPHTEPVAFAVYDDTAQAEDAYYKLGPGWSVGAAPYIKVRGVGINPHNNPSTGCTDFTWVLVKLTIVLPDKGEIELRDDQSDGVPQAAQPFGTFGCRTQDGYRAKRWHATDGSGAVFYSDNDNGVVNGDLAGKLITADGTVYRFINANFGNSSGSAYLNNLGRCSSVTDRNGNQILITYPTNTRVQYTDQLGRVTTLDINDPSLAPYVLQVTLPGYNGQNRIYKVRRDTMNLHYRSGINPTLPVINGDWDPIGYGYEWPGPHTTLFPVSYGSGAERIDNRQVVTQLLLPDNRALNFNYNEFGEVAELKMVSTDLVTAINSTQYDHQSVTLNTLAGTGLPAGNSLACEVHPTAQQASSNVSAIDRAVTARRTYPDGSTLEGSWSYSFKIDKTEVQCRNASNAILLDEWHYFMTSQRFLSCVQGSPDGTGYSLWSTGIERRNERRDTNLTTVLAATELDWSQRASIVWSGFTAQQIPNDNRVNEERRYLDNGSFAKVHTFYDPTIAATNHINNPSEVDEYDFDQTLKRYTTTTYKTGTPYTSTGVNTVNLLSLPLQQSVFDGGTGVETARTTTEYDNYTADGNNQLLATYGDYSSIPGHKTSYDTSFTARGNATKVSRMVSSGTFVDGYARYDVLGNPVSTKDPRGFETAINYLDDFGDGGNPGFNTGGHSSYAMPTRITSPPPNPGEPQHIAYVQFDFSTGLLTGFKDRNGIITQTIYNDSFDRPTQIKTALGTTAENHTAMYYAPQTNPFGIFLSNNDVLTAKDQAGIDDGNLRNWIKTDGFGRTIDAFTRDLQGDVRTTTTYDGLGRARRVTNPYRSTSDPTYGYADSTYDMIGRVTRVETFDVSNASTGAVTTAYSGSQTTTTDQAGKVRRGIIDGLGRLKQVIEDPNALAHSTTYGYDALDDLTSVTQGAQPRTFVYDGLKRLKQATNPENGTINYSYDANSNMLTKQDARGVTTTYTYDALNRMASRSYTNDPQNTPAVSYKYDAQGLPAGAPSFTRGYSTGRLVAVNYGGGSSGNYAGYDQLGRVNVSYQQTDSQNYGFTSSYNLASQMISQTYPSGRLVNTSYDTSGRISGINGQKTGEPNKTYATQFSYAAHSAISAMQLGNGKWEHTNFNSRLQPLQIGLGVSAADSSTLKLDYGYGTTSNNGNVLSQTITIGATVMSQSYGYDALNRLQTASENSGAAWSQTYGYDRFGNRWVSASTGYALSPLTPQSQSAFNAGNNRLVASQYDLAGNQTVDAQSRTFSYDGENRQTSFNSTAGQYFYDGEGRRVKKIDSTGTTVFVYDSGGHLIAEYHSDPVPPPAGGGGTSYLTSDHLGSTRVVTRSDGSVKSRYDYLPFGEELGSGIGLRTTAQGYSVADSTRQKFASKERDSESGLDYFGSRYFSGSQGRFTGVDSVKLTPVRMLDPQRFNLYAYVRNNPMKLIDPEGKDVSLANDTKETRRRALLNVTVNLTTSEQRNIGIRKDANGKYQLYVKDPSKIDPSKASAGYKYLTNLINNHQLNISYTLIPKGGSATGKLDGMVYTQKALSAAGDSGGVTAYVPNSKTGGYDAEIFVPEGGSPYGVKGLTKSGKDVQIANPDFMTTAHELFGETFKLTPGNEHLQKNLVDDSDKVIKIENEIRQFHGLPLRSGKDHGYMREEMIVRPK